MGALSIVFNAMKTRDIEEMEERYLKPLIAVMEPVARLSVESQVSNLYMKFNMSFHYRLQRNCLWLLMLRATHMVTVEWLSQDLALKYCGPMLHAHLTRKSSYILSICIAHWSSKERWTSRTLLTLNSWGWEGFRGLPLIHQSVGNKNLERVEWACSLALQKPLKLIIEGFFFPVT